MASRLELILPLSVIFTFEGHAEVLFYGTTLHARDRAARRMIERKENGICGLVLQVRSNITLNIG
jgi:tartrate dehydratase beta subunit/fumarate hydratase class I family protein